MDIYPNGLHSHKRKVNPFQSSVQEVVEFLVSLLSGGVSYIVLLIEHVVVLSIEPRSWQNRISYYVNPNRDARVFGTCSLLSTISRVCGQMISCL